MGPEGWTKTKLVTSMGATSSLVRKGGRETPLPLQWCRACSSRVSSRAVSTWSRRFPRFPTPSPSVARTMAIFTVLHT